MDPYTAEHREQWLTDQHLKSLRDSLVCGVMGEGGSNDESDSLPVSCPSQNPKPRIYLDSNRLIISTP